MNYKQAKSYYNVNHLNFIMKTFKVPLKYKVEKNQFNDYVLIHYTDAGSLPKHLDVILERNIALDKANRMKRDYIEFFNDYLTVEFWNQSNYAFPDIKDAQNYIKTARRLYNNANGVK